MSLSFSVDTGGTFTDLVVVDGAVLTTFKSSTTPLDLVEGVLDVFGRAALARGETREELLAQGDLLVYSTTQATNALVTEKTARTALLTTEGHEDVLVLREGGRVGAFDFSSDYPQPFVRRALTFGIRERIGSEGETVVPLDEQSVLAVIDQLETLAPEAVGVCFLWSVANPVHELRVGSLLRDSLPGVAVTLSHELNPSIREFRRASSTVLDAALKPIMTAHLQAFEERLGAAGFGGKIFMSTSGGALQEMGAVARAPIHAVKSGPAMAPIAARFYAARDSDAKTVIVTDSGGTSFDVSLVQRGAIPKTRETWVGGPQVGVITGFPSVDVRSVGAGGGSIARVDDGRLLHVGPDSAGGDPGPVCYRRGGRDVTVTDAALVLGYLNPHRFLGGALELDPEAAERALENQVGGPLGLTAQEAAAAVLEVLVANMVAAIEQITVNQGIDPRDALIVAGGGAAGLAVAAVARGLGCTRVLIPETGATLSAAGALLAEHAATFRAIRFTSSDNFDYAGVNEVLTDLEARCAGFVARVGPQTAARVDLFVEVRYPRQVWELEMPLGRTRFESTGDVDRFSSEFHALHERVFAYADLDSPVEVVTWGATVALPGDAAAPAASVPPAPGVAQTTRRAWLPGVGFAPVAVLSLDSLPVGEPVAGPAILEAPFTTVVVDAGATAERLAHGGLSIALAPTASLQAAAPAHEAMRA